MMRNRNTLGGGSMLNMVSPINWLHPLNNRGLVARWLCIPGLMGGSRLVNLTRAGDKDGKHGTRVNEPAWNVTPFRQGGFGSLRFVRASTQYVLCNSAVILGGSTNWTMAAWYSGTDTNDNAIYSERAPPAGGNDILKLQASFDGKFAVVYRNDGGTLITVSTSTAVRTGGWQHIVGTKFGTAITVYVDGVSRGSGTFGSASDAFTDANIQARIGSDQADATAYLGGSVDDVWLSNVCLSAGEVAALYEDSRRGSPDTLNWISTRTYFLAEGAGGVSPPEVPYRLRGGGIAEIAWPVWGQSFRF